MKSELRRPGRPWAAGLAACVLAVTIHTALPAAEPAPAAASPALPEIAKGPYTQDLETFKQYQCPDWFRDAKLGMWAHWGPQAVPMMGDWYARHLYVEGHPQNKYHLENYGHPSKFGYKDIIPLWKAEKWDPERLMALYRKAGARYFVSMGVHHDNFDLWDSKHNRWNAVKMGPKRDIVGEWQKAARNQGMRFGVSEHLGASFTWFQTSRGADKQGPQAGVPYDGTDPKFEDLYHWAAKPDDKAWYSNDPKWHLEWFKRIKDLVDSYRPDLLYTDGALPFGAVGASLVAHYYNSSAARTGGRPEAIYTCKQQGTGKWMEDLERGVMSGVNPYPWQTDTSIGDWYYNRNWKFRKVDWVIHMLVDIVSKNGNLLINVVQKPDGSLDPEVEVLLEEMAAWMAVNGEAIYGTRPWKVYGEGRTRAKGGHFNEDYAFSSEDIRFTMKGDTLFAFAMGWPADGRISVRSLAKIAGTGANRITGVSLLGHEGKIEWTQTGEALVVGLPAKRPAEHALALRIQGSDLAPAPLPAVSIRPAADGSLRLGAESADLLGGLKVEAQGGEPNIGFWDNGSDRASWERVAFRKGTYAVTAMVATLQEGAGLAVDVGGRKLQAASPVTGAWDRFKEVSLGTVEIQADGDLTVRCGAREGAAWKAINLRWIRLAPAK